jgi:hypothetical protein
MNKHQAIHKLNPNVTLIRGDEAFDKDNNKVNYDNAAVEALVASEAYKEKRAAEYPSFIEYLDGVVKGDQAQIQAYIDACQAIKNKYPKGK